MKKAILDAAAQLIQQYGLKKFTIDEIAAELKISKKTIYRHYRSKDDIVRAYFEAAVSSDKSSVRAALAGNGEFIDKIHAIFYSRHCYRLTVPILSEAKRFYPESWAQVEDLKRFKVDATRELFRQGVDAGIFRSDISFGILSKMLEEISDMFTDYDFLLENRLTTREAIDEALKIIFNGILITKSAG